MIIWKLRKDENGEREREISERRRSDYWNRHSRFQMVIAED